jgi:hypothetical protein
MRPALLGGGANWYLDLLDRAAELYLHPESS